MGWREDDKTRPVITRFTSMQIDQRKGYGNVQRMCKESQNKKVWRRLNHKIQRDDCEWPQIEEAGKSLLRMSESHH